MGDKGLNFPSIGMGRFRKMFLVLDYSFNIQNYEAENMMLHSFVS